MISLPLSLDPVNRGDLPTDDRAAAWLIPGGDAELWLHEMCHWGIPLDDVRLLILPVATNDPRPAGVLAISDTATDIATSPLVSPYRKLAGRLFIPAQTRLRPQMSEDELRQWLVWDTQVLHPTIGLIGCRAEELRRVSDLLAVTPPLATDWSVADPGVAADARVISVKPARLPEIGQFLSESSDDIGEEKPTELPPLPSESPLNKLMARSALGGLAAMKWLADHLPGGGGGGLSDAQGEPGKSPAGGAGAGQGGMIQRMRDWIRTRQEQWRQGLEDARNKELARLLRMLESKPDEGLRYALPLSGGESHRGLAAPAARLGLRRTDFSFSSLFSSSAGDPWRIEHEMRQKLMAKYRDLASRELGLGRYRRAAYVFAHLLGDFHSAANALEQGRFFREAATLYREKLRNPHRAAVCLENGGLLEEAAESYLALKHLEKAGDLYRQLTREEDAVRAYRQAVAECETRRDFLAAAKLLEAKLDARDEALDLLWKQWPTGAQATQCLREYFAMMGRSAQHEEVARRVGNLVAAPFHATHIRGLADVLAELTSSYPSHAIRAQAADGVRVIVGRRLARTTPSDEFSLLEVRELVNTLSRTGLNDRLLRRDGTRFVDDLTARQPKPVSKPAPRTPPRALPARRKIALLHAFALGMEAQWRTAVARGGMIYAQGVRPDGVVVARANWEHAQQHALLRRNFSGDVSYRLELAPREGATQRLHLIPIHTHALHPSALGVQTLAASTVFRENLAVSIPSILPPGIVHDATFDESDRLWVVHDSLGVENLVLSVFDRGEVLSRSNELPIAVPEPARASSVMVAAVGGITCVTHDRQLDIIPQLDGPSTASAAVLDLGGTAVSAVASPPHTRPRVAVAFAEGACVCWPAERHIARFAADIFDPVIGLTRDGLLVAAGRQRVAVYQVNGMEPQLLATDGPRAALPVSVLSAPGEGCFAILYADGLVQVMKCSP